jgi:hypothetical protein
MVAIMLIITAFILGIGAIVFLFMLRRIKRGTRPGRPNASFSIYKDGKMALIAITQDGRIVLLNPREVKQMFYAWDLQNEPVLTTEFGTVFSVHYPSQYADSEKARILQRNGIYMYIIIDQQGRQTRYQTGEVIHLNNVAAQDLKKWVEKIKHTNEFIQLLYEGEF